MILTKLHSSWLDSRRLRFMRQIQCTRNCHVVETNIVKWSLLKDSFLVYYSDSSYTLFWKANLNRYFLGFLFKTCLITV